MRKKPSTVGALTELGRVRLSKSFFMRDMLHSEIAQVHGLLNAPDDPELAIAAGKRLCEELLEPLQDEFGRIDLYQQTVPSNVDYYFVNRVPDRIRQWALPIHTATLRL